jgi:hypothetical protein
MRGLRGLCATNVQAAKLTAAISGATSSLGDHPSIIRAEDCNEQSIRNISHPLLFLNGARDRSRSTSFGSEKAQHVSLFQGKCVFKFAILVSCTMPTYLSQLACSNGWETLNHRWQQRGSRKTTARIPGMRPMPSNSGEV